MFFFQQKSTWRIIQQNKMAEIVNLKTREMFEALRSTEPRSQAGGGALRAPRPLRPKDDHTCRGTHSGRRCRSRCRPGHRRGHRALQVARGRGGGGGWQLQFRQSVAEGVPLSCAWLKPKKLGSHNYHICPTAKGWVKADKKCMIESYNTTHQLNKHNIEHR